MADTIDSARASGKQDVAQAQGIQTVEGAALIARAILPIAPSGSSVVTAIQRLARAHVIPEALLAALDEPLGGAIATAAEYAGSALSEATKRAYARDWFHFADWCRQQAVDPAGLPIHPVLVAAYLASLAGTLGRSALNGRLAAIAHEHRRRGLAWNAGHPAIRETLQGVGRKHGRPVRPAAALTSVEIKQFLAIRRNDLAGLRDRALFLIGFAGALRRSELVAIDHPQLRFEAGSVTIHIPGPNATISRMRDKSGGVSDTCPVQALERWLAKARIRRGAVFRSVTVGSKLGDPTYADPLWDGREIPPRIPGCSAHRAWPWGRQ